MYISNFVIFVVAALLVVALLYVYFLGKTHGSKKISRLLYMQDRPMLTLREQLDSVLWVRSFFSDNRRKSIEESYSYAKDMLIEAHRNVSDIANDENASQDDVTKSFIFLFRAEQLTKEASRRFYSLRANK